MEYEVLSIKYSVFNWVSISVHVYFNYSNNNSDSNSNNNNNNNNNKNKNNNKNSIVPCDFMRHTPTHLIEVDMQTHTTGVQPIYGYIGITLAHQLSMGVTSGVTLISKPCIIV